MSETYSDSFWGGDLSSCAGYEALVRRNAESKKMCQELEEYLKKRSKLEAEYSKSLHNLEKCFKPKEEIGVLDVALNRFRSEIEATAQGHNKAATLFQQQSDIVKRFREDQTIQRKALEEQLLKCQSSKLAQLSKTIQLEKSYVRKFTDRDAAELNFKDLNTQQVLPKELEKAKNKLTKAEEEAEKADSAYKSAVKVLDSCRASWEREMTSACQSIQDLDEKRIDFLRQELWRLLNINSMLALNIDSSSESVREVLEDCDIDSDIKAFIQVAKTGQDRPEPFVFKHYTKIVTTCNSDDTQNPYCTVADIDVTGNETSSSPISKAAKLLWK